MSAVPTHQNVNHGDAPPYDQPYAPSYTDPHCKRCGRQFARTEGVNPASAQFHRCEDCNKKQTREMLLVNATCGASSLCNIQ